MLRIIKYSLNNIRVFHKEHNTIFARHWFSRANSSWQPGDTGEYTHRGAVTKFLAHTCRTRHHVFQGFCGSRGAHSTLRFTQFGICQGVLATPTAAHRSSVLGIQMYAVVFDYTQDILWIDAWRILGPAPIMRNASHHPSWHIAKVCPTTQTGVSKRNRRLKTRRR